MNTLAVRLALTLVTGGLIGAAFVTTKLLLNAGANPVAVAFVPVAAAAAFLAVALRARGESIPRDRGALVYFFVSALLFAAAVPLVGNWVLARIPAGIFTVLVTLSPMFTALFNALVDRRAPAAHTIVGTALGLAGVLLVLVPRAQRVEAEQALALAVALAVPMLLAAGNVYRSRRWPRGLSSPAASAGNLVAQSLLIAPAFAFAPHGNAEVTLSLWPLFALSIAMTIGWNLAGSALQRAAGAAAYSQIGYVIALTGIVAGAVLFDESLGTWFWPAVGLVFAGIVVTNRPLAPAAVTVLAGAAAR